MKEQKELDNLARDMIKCKADGYGSYYGRWKAAQGQNPEQPKEKTVPEGMSICKHCGKPFVPKSYRKQLYCDAVCQVEESRDRTKREKTVSNEIDFDYEAEDIKE